MMLFNFLFSIAPEAASVALPPTMEFPLLSHEEMAAKYLRRETNSEGDIEEGWGWLAPPEATFVAHISIYTHAILRMALERAGLVVVGHRHSHLPDHPFSELFEVAEQFPEAVPSTLTSEIWGWEGSYRETWEALDEEAAWWTQGCVEMSRGDVVPRLTVYGGGGEVSFGVYLHPGHMRLMEVSSGSTVPQYIFLSDLVEWLEEAMPHHLHLPLHEGKRIRWKRTLAIEAEKALFD